MPEATFTFRVDDDLKARFSDAARRDDRTGAQLLRDFMRSYVERGMPAHDAWFRRQVQIGLDAAGAGETISAEEVEAEAEAWRQEMRDKIG
jgi:predicted transcriptional regulator